MLAVPSGGHLGAHSLPPEVGAREARSDYGMVATGSAEATEAAVAILENGDNPECPGYLKPNSVCKSDMAPTIVLDGGSLLAAVGTPGSNRIPPIVTEVISNLIDRRMAIRDAVAAPRILWGGMRWLRVWIELNEPFTDADVAAFERIGYRDMTVLSQPAPEDDTAANFGGVNAVAYDPSTGRYTGVVDPRRGGLAMGPRVVVKPRGQQ